MGVGHHLLAGRGDLSLENAQHGDVAVKSRRRVGSDKIDVKIDRMHKIENTRGIVQSSNIWPASWL